LQSTPPEGAAPGAEGTNTTAPPKVIKKKKIKIGDVIKFYL